MRVVASEAMLYFNPSCSKCRTADSLLKERGVETTVVRYLDRAPTVEELKDLMVRLRIDDPKDMMRLGEDLYSQLGLGEVTAERCLEAIAEHPILLERPIFIVGDRAVIARPPERLLEIL